MRAQDLALQRHKYKHLNNTQWEWFLQQVEGRERTAEKIPAFTNIEDWWFPPRISCEQCSSELTARYKAALTKGEKMLDLTGGYGVDTFFLKESFSHIDYVEQNTELCRIATHNFANYPIDIHNCTAEDFIENAELYNLIFIDPARRNKHGGKVFRLQDCTPNVVNLLPSLITHLNENGNILLKLSPMLDITQALKELSACSWDIHIVAVKNEVKEVLLFSGGNERITAIDLTEPEKKFVFFRQDELSANAISTNENLIPSLKNNSLPDLFLYEPNAAILKSGAYKLIGQRFNLQKLDANTHLYFSEKYLPHFPGRVWKVNSILSCHSATIKQANVLTRNYPLTAEQLRKKMKIKDGGTNYIIGCRINSKPTLFVAQRISDINSPLSAPSTNPNSPLSAPSANHSSSI